MFPKTQKSPDRGWKSGLAFGFAKKPDKKTTVRSLDAKTVKVVLERDGFACVLCGSSDLDPPHHAYFGLEANRGPDRNSAGQLVTICKACHYGIHSQGDAVKRERCKEYLENFG